MAKVSPFQKAYNQGYKDGFMKGTVTPSKKIVNNDCAYILGGVLVVLKQLYGFGDTRLRKVAEGIQQFWVDEAERKNATKGQPGYEDTIQYVKRITGINILQYDEDLKDEYEEHTAD